MSSENDTTKPTPKVKAVDETISIERAWQVGRRIYVRCAYESKLGAQMREIGANWDREQRRLWVGSGKKNQVIPLVQAADARARAVDDIKKASRWVRVPYEATEIRAEVRRLGGVYDGERKAWAMPSEDSYAAVKTQVAQYRDRLAAAEQAAKEKQRQDKEAARDAEQARAEAARTERRERLLTESGRTPTGESVEHRVISTRRMNKAMAWDTARPLGTLIVLGDGRRGIIVDRAVWFTNSEFASSTCWHPQTHDEAHWDFAYTLALVEPSAAERAADAEQAARIADAAALHRLVEDVARTEHGQLDVEWTAIPAEQRAGEVRRTYGTVGRHDGGRLILTTTGELIYQHPGYYDDYRRTQRTLPRTHGLVDQARALIDQGPRTRTHRDQVVYDYEVIVTSPDAEPTTTASDTVKTQDTSSASQVSDPVGPDDTSRAMPEAASPAAQDALDLVEHVVGVDTDLIARLATAIEHDEDTIEEFSDEDQFLSARRGIEVTLVRHTFTLPDGQVIALWAVVDAWWEVYEDADADSTRAVYVDEPTARARWREQVAEHKVSPPRAVHPEFDEPDDEFQRR